MRPQKAFVRGFALTAAGAAAGLAAALAVPVAEEWIAVTAAGGALFSFAGWLYATRHARAARRLERSREEAMRRGYRADGGKAERS